jgi:hypothetical protein
MIAISTSSTPHHTRVRRAASHSLWRDIGIGLAFPGIVLAAMALQQHGYSTTQVGYQSPGFEEPMSASGWENTVPPAMFSLGALSAEAER